MTFNGSASAATADYFRNYTGVEYAPEVVAAFTAEVSRLDARDIDVRGLGKTMVPDASDARTLLEGELGGGTDDNYVAFAFSKLSANRIDFSFGIRSPTAAGQDDAVLADHLARVAEKHYAAGGDAMAATAHALSVYADVASAEVAFAPVEEDLYQSLGDGDNDDSGGGERLPYIRLEADSWVLTPSGVPLRLCAGTRAMFFPVSSPYAGCLFKFQPSVPGAEYARPYRATKFVKGAGDYVGKFAGYRQEPLLGQAGNFYNYCAVNCGDQNGDCEKPASKDAYQEVLLGLVGECEDQVVSHHLSVPTSYRVKANDLSDPQGNPAYANLHPAYPRYACVGEFLPFRQLFTTPDLIIRRFEEQQPLFVTITNIDGYRNYAGYRCVIEDLVDAASITKLENEGYARKFSQSGREGMYILANAGGKVLAMVDYFADSDEPAYFHWIANLQKWVPIERAPNQTSAAVFDLFVGLGKVAALSAFVGANIAFGAGAASFAVNYFGLTGFVAAVATATTPAGVDIFFAGAEGAALYAYGDREAAAAALKIGALSALAGSAFDIGLEVYRLAKYSKSSLKFASDADRARFTRGGDLRPDNVGITITDTRGRSRIVELEGFDATLRGAGVPEVGHEEVYAALSESRSLRNLLLDPANGDLVTTYAKVARVDGAAGEALLADPARLGKLHDDVLASDYALRRAIDGPRGEAAVRGWRRLADFDDAYLRGLRQDPAAVTKLGDDLISEPGLRPFLDEHGAEGVLAWKWLDEAFPNRKLCKTL